MKFLSIHWKPRRDGARVDGMPMEAQLRRQFGRCHISALSADKENVAFDGAIRVLSRDRVYRLQTESNARIDPIERSIGKMERSREWVNE
jgi:hypothetical protein